MSVWQLFGSVALASCLLLLVSYRPLAESRAGGARGTGPTPRIRNGPRGAPNLLVLYGYTREAPGERELEK